MDQKEKTTREEIIDLVKDSVLDYIAWLKPNSIDSIFLTIIKTILKIPVTLFLLLVSPVLLILLSIIFIVLI